MTKDQVDTHSKMDSHKWLDVGTGDLGKVYLEIIGADHLENKDGGLGRDKTDAFCAIVYEDCIVKTDVVDDCLTPRWLPWMQRAFILRREHCSSQIFLGVFDYDSGLAGKHDLLGRVSLDISNLKPNTDYTLGYALFKSAKVGNRNQKGTVTVRLRIDFQDERKAILSNLTLPQVVYVNVKDKDDFRVVRKTIEGKHDTKKYNIDTLKSHIDELQSLKMMLFYLQDSVLTLIFWRGHFPVHLRLPGTAPASNGSNTSTTQTASLLDTFTTSTTIYLPLHSLTAFMLGVIVVERPFLAPSFFFFLISWLLLACMDYRRNVPNPWSRCRTFEGFLRTLLLGYSSSASVAAHENEEESKMFEDKWKLRLTDTEEATAKAAEEMLEKQEEYEKMTEEIGETTAETDISTKKGGGISIAPLKPILFPIQQLAGNACECVRFVKNVILWEECYFSFLLAAGSLLTGFVFLFVPWAFLTRWGMRLFMWGLLGPWMKLVDIYWYQKKPTEDEEEKREVEERTAKIEALEHAAANARVEREEAAQKKDMTALLYGKYITKVPVIKGDRYRDTPLPTSTATPWTPNLSKTKTKGLALAPQIFRVGGQNLSGNMIPKIKPK